jgi:hypothetical protein
VQRFLKFAKHVPGRNSACIGQNLEVGTISFQAVQQLIVYSKRTTPISENICRRFSETAGVEADNSCTRSGRRVHGQQYASSTFQVQLSDQDEATLQCDPIYGIFQGALQDNSQRCGDAHDPLDVRFSRVEDREEGCSASEASSARDGVTSWAP